MITINVLGILWFIFLWILAPFILNIMLIALFTSTPSYKYSIKKSKNGWGIMEWFLTLMFFSYAGTVFWLGMGIWGYVLALYFNFLGGKEKTSY